MKKIKSFKEYVEEQELLKEASSERMKARYKNIANRNKVEAPSEEKPQIGNVGLDFKTQYVINPIGFLKINERDSQKKIEKLSQKLAILEHTYNNLSKITTYILKPIEPSEKNQDDNTATEEKPQEINKDDLILNISHGKSCASFYNMYYSLLNTANKNLKNSQEVTALINQMKSGNLDQRQKAYNALKDMGIYPNENEKDVRLDKEIDYENKNTNIKDDINFEDNILDEALTGSRIGTFLRAVNPFSRTNTGIKTEKLNNFSSDKILKTTNKAKYAKEYLKQAYDKYVSETDKSISKNRPYIASDLRAANKLIDNYIKKHRYTHVPDQDYIFKITSYLDSAYRLLIGVGSDIEIIATNYGKSMQKKLNDLNIKTAENKELSSSLDTKTAMRKVEDRTKLYKQTKIKEKELLDKANSIYDELRSKHNLKNLDKQRKEEEDNVEKEYVKSHFNDIIKIYKDETLEKALNDFRTTYISTSGKINKKQDKTFTLKTYPEESFKLTSDDQKKLAAEAFCIFALGKKKLDNTKGFVSRKAEKMKEDIFDKLYSEVYKELESEDYTKILNYIDKNLIKKKEEKSNDPKQDEAIRSTTDGKSEPESNADTNTQADNSKWSNRLAAKDFDGEQPKSIYAYAIQKAKKLQER